MSVKEDRSQKRCFLSEKTNVAARVIHDEVLTIWDNFGTNFRFGDRNVNKIRKIINSDSNKIYCVSNSYVKKDFSDKSGYSISFSSSPKMSCYHDIVLRKEECEKLVEMINKMLMGKDFNNNNNKTLFFDYSI